MAKTNTIEIYTTTTGERFALIDGALVPVKEESAKAATPKKPQKPKVSGRKKDKAPVQAEPAPTPEWIVKRAQNKDANRALAAEMRALGMTPNGEAWDYAKAHGAKAAAKKFSK